MHELNGKIIDGRALFVTKAQKKEERQAELTEKYAQYEGRNLYVKNLEDEFDDDLLKHVFSQFGTITSAKVKYLFHCSENTSHAILHLTPQQP